MDWRGVGAGPAPSARTNNVSGAVELPWHLYLVKGLALEMHEQLRLHFLNGVHFVITEENTPVGI